MKLVFTALVLALSLGAQASYFEDNCSNGDGTARWETGHNNNEIYFRVQDDSTGEYSEHKFSASDVKIKFTKKKHIAKRTVDYQCSSTFHTYYSATAQVTPREEIRTQFNSIFKSGKFKDFVICHDQVSGEAPECPESR
ncbi:MAG TPA: hypothetical protein VNJ01_18200 [Bacteriovoracaceae bacterium]|nr:hypothetical protein [Bacteriovoracaceae bacterium]